MTPQIYEDIRQEILAVCREKVAAMMIRLSIATGHGDTFDDLLGELEAALEDPVVAFKAEATALRQEFTRLSSMIDACAQGLASMRQHCTQLEATVEVFRRRLVNVEARAKKL